jgi:hypothetical protein
MNARSLFSAQWDRLAGPAYFPHLQRQILILGFVLFLIVACSRRIPAFSAFKNLASSFGVCNKQFHAAMNRSLARMRKLCYPASSLFASLQARLLLRRAEFFQVWGGGDDQAQRDLKNPVSLSRNHMSQEIHTQQSVYIIRAWRYTPKPAKKRLGRPATR